ncbi:MAG TPA: LytR C-terminal domain-containing protein [Solirubrobacterales bacterium]|nr:LytR C-terminal domain-containing protein [Solirubrobacterales bacterium]
MHAIKSIGPVLGIVAFGGLAILAFLLFQQARDLRRLREWAGRAPERAQEAADAAQAAADAAKGEGADEEAPAQAHPSAGGLRGRLAGYRARIKDAVGPRLAEADRRLPIDGRILVALVVAALIAAGVATSGFGLVGGGGGADKHQKHNGRPNVAVLNGTAVPNLAAQVDQQVLKPAGYKSGTVSNAGSTFAQTVVMYDSGHRADAKSLATAIQPKLGKTPTQAMTSDVRSHAGAAPLAVAVGLDDSSTLGAG